ncbi:MAG: AmmeMemoRadiSam system radical SAM enzyme [Candidatus Omnitrophota bacterium]
MKEALFYKKIKEDMVECLLCPHFCHICDGQTGICGVRINKGGTLYTANYGNISSLALDPIEKKPLYHFHPGERILSVGTVGCNFACRFCQNWNISKDVNSATEFMSCADLVTKASELHSFGIAYTYNEPFIWYEYVYEAAQLGKKAGLDNVLVTNGFVNLAPLEKILPFIDAMNIDLKSIQDDFYQKICHGRLNPVLETIKLAKKSCHVELTNLIVPTLNDSDQDLTDLVGWIYDNLGPAVPLHFSRYFPCYKMTLPPTPKETLLRAQKIALQKLKYVYLGNI